MAALEYTIEVTTPLGVALPTQEEMAEVVQDAIARWNGIVPASLVDVEVTRVSDDL
jgi:hypothetical protein